ncbi:hypothetical protein HGH92_14345 [Chitinophaga varians]|uniref:Tetratricopeptide repeat protein n=1 Tax=Chitinophaga varians TaxID=2202339 RepID=A0A847RUE5_9BACT|nr:hypothetical protein [Chitinophaga varians]NLR65494.1 hypothetical protein [Chitinophaga varians]
MNLEELERLYQEQAYTVATIELETYLEEHPAEAAAWYLMGKCRLEIAKSAEDREEMTTAYQTAYEAFSKALEYNPQHVQARVHRAYMGANVINDKVAETLEDCQFILDQGDEELITKALLYRFQIWVLQNETDKALADMHRNLEIYQSLYHDDLPQLNVARFQCYTRIGDVYYHNDNKPTALDYYRQAFQCTVYNNRTLSTLHFALEMADYDFAAEMLHIASTSGEQEEEDMLKILHQVKALLDQGVRHPALAREFCWGTIDFWHQFYGEDEAEGTLEQISTGKRFISLYPEESYFYHFTATALFNIGSYSESLPYYEKAIAMRPYPSTIIRWYYAHYKTHGEFPDNWTDLDYPIAYDWYSAGVVCNELLQEEQASGPRQILTQLKKYLYQKAYALYYPYWYENTGSSYAGHPHHFAMCCNNYGITLFELGAYEEAIHIHSVGYNMSPFWEQLESRADAFHQLGKYAEAVADRQMILNTFISSLPLVYYVSIHERIIEDLTALERYDDAMALYNKILTEYEEWITNDMDELEEEEKEIIIYNIDRIKTGRAFIKTNSQDDLHERIQALEKHLEEKPDDSDAYFNLMYLYYDNAQYEHCIGAVNNRISIGGIAKLPLVSQMKIFYFRGKAALKLNRYEAAIQDMLQTLEIMSHGDESDNSPNNRCGVYAFLAEAYLGLEDYDNSLQYANQCVQTYKDMNWSWDAESSAFYYTMALAQEGKGDLSACRKTIDRILEKDPGFQPAVSKKAGLKNGSGLFSFLRKKKD